MSFFKCTFIFSLIFFISCGEKKKASSNSNQPTEITAEEAEIIEDYVQQVEPVDPQEEIADSSALIEAEEPIEISNGLKAVSNKCNIHNYKDYIFDFQKVDQLIAETGAGCYLPGVDFSGQNLENAVFTQSDLRGANFKGAKLQGVKFIKANLTGANFEDSNYLHAYYRGAILTRATYNEYGAIKAWIRAFSGQGIRDPESEGMIYTGK